MQCLKRVGGVEKTLPNMIKGLRENELKDVKFRYQEENNLLYKRHKQ